ncbi:MAG: tetratricopeptide repeat protein [Planctomycetota bacterium]|jgi:tetratricopeptide (TPR) repeat protein
MKSDYFTKTKIQLNSWDDTSGTVTRKALILTYRALGMICLIFMIISFSLAGFIYAKYKQKIKIIEDNKKMSLYTEKAFFDLAKQQKTIIEKLPKLFQTPRPSQLSPDEFINKYGATAKLHVEVSEYFRNSEFEQCIEAAQELIETEDLSDDLKRDAFVKIAWSNFYLKKYVQTDLEIEKAMKVYPNLYPLLQLRVDMLIMKNKLKDAEFFISRIEKEKPTLQLFFSKGNLQWQKGNVDRAADIFRKILASSNIRLILSSANNLAIIYSKEKKDFKTAHFYLDLMQSMAPSGFTTMRTSGKVYMMQKKYKEAENAFKAAEKIFPENLDIVLSLSILYKMSGKKDLSESYFKKALKLSPLAEEQLVEIEKSMLLK